MISETGKDCDSIAETCASTFLALLNTLSTAVTVGFLLFGENMIRNLPEILNFEGRNTSLSFRYSPLDSDSLQRDVYELQWSQITDANEDLDMSFQHWLAQLRHSLPGNTILTARLEIQSPMIRLLQESGFLFTEFTIQPEISNLQSMQIANPDLGVRLADPSKVKEIAVNTPLFGVSRFHFDHRIPNDLADKRFQEWLLRAADSDEDECLTVFNANTSEELALFVVRRSENDVRWILTAVLPPFQGRGLATRVWNAMLSHHKKLGVEKVFTNISAQNTRTIPVYVNAGFDLSRTSLCLHTHFSPHKN
jgi:GNAT superfamily N-acetyltransferase